MNFPSWSPANIYEINTRQYTAEGTLSALIPHLQRLRSMNVDTLWFMPLTPISVMNRKGTLGSYYACADYEIISPEFGTEDDFRIIVEQAHQLGMKVIIDWVANHTGWDHTWTMQNREYYKQTEDGNFQTPSGMEDIIELNFHNEEMISSMIHSMKSWITRFNIDGFRCDLASWVPLTFWEKARTELAALKPLFFLGEFDELDHPDYGKVFNASYSWKWMHRTKDFADQKTSLKSLYELLLEYQQLGSSSQRAWFTSNHDENSWNGTEYEKYGALAASLAIFSATWEGIPLLYSGQEIPNLKRLKFFDKDEIEWNAKPRLEDFYRILLKSRHDHAALQPGSVTHLLNIEPSDRVLAFTRRNGNARALVLLNFSSAPVEISLQSKYYEDLEEIFTGETVKDRMDIITGKIYLSR